MSGALSPESDQETSNTEKQSDSQNLGASQTVSLLTQHIDRDGTVVVWVLIIDRRTES